MTVACSVVGLPPGCYFAVSAMRARRFFLRFPVSELAMSFSSIPDPQASVPPELALVRRDAEVAIPTGGIADLFGVAVAQFLNERDVAERTQDDYARSLARFRDWIREDGRELRTDTLRRYRDALLERRMTPLSIGTYLTAPRLFCEFLAARGFLGFVPRVRRPRVPKGHHRDTISPRDLCTVLGAIDTGTLIGLRDYALLVVMAQTGPRTIEIHRARVEHLRTRGGLITLAVHGKGFEGESRTLYLEPSTLAPLRHYLRERGRLGKRVHVPPEAPLFAVHGPRNRGGPLTTRAIRHIVAERCEAVGVKTPRLTAHSFRHTAATEALRGGASNVDVRDMLGHATTATTDIYLHNLQREERRAERYVDLGLPQFEPRPVQDDAA